MKIETGHQAQIGVPHCAEQHWQLGFSSRKQRSQVNFVADAYSCHIQLGQGVNSHSVLSLELWGTK